MKISISTKLSFLIIMIVVLPISYILYSTVVVESKEKLNTAYQLQLTEVKYADVKLMSILNPVQNTLRNIASMDIKTKTQEQYKNDINNILNNQKEIKDIVITEVPLIKAQSSNVVFNTNDEVKSFISNQISDNYQYIVKNQKIFFGLYEDLANQKIVLNIVDDSYDPAKTKVLIYSAIIDLSEFSKELNYLTHIYFNESILYNSDKVKSDVDLNNPAFFKVKNGSFEFNIHETKYLASYSKVGMGITIVMAQPLVKVLAYQYQLYQKIAVVGIIAILMSLIIGNLLSSWNISRPIQKLVLATSDVAKGKFDINVDASSKDEIGILGDSFNKMSSKIKMLLKHQLEAIKLENEVNIAATVQQTLFPLRDTKTSTYEINSFYASASACGGDIWNYFENNNKIYVMIADATGHGLPSAFITVAAKTSFSIVESMIKNQGKDVALFDILNYANHAIYEASKGKINMTMWIGVVDLNQDSIEYINAGHNSPWVITRDKTFKTLHAEGKRLGEEVHLKESEYEIKKTGFNYGDNLFLYTDGINEGTNSSDEQFGKKRMKHVLLNNIDKKPLVELMRSFVIFSKKAPNMYEDDITLVMIKHDNEKENVA